MHPTYSRTHPFIATLRERYDLSGPDSDKITKHLVLDLKGSGIHYKVGDSLAIFALNDPTTVNRVLKTLGATGEEIVIPKGGDPTPLRQFLSAKANLQHCGRSLLQLMETRQRDAQRQAALQMLLLPENKEEMNRYLHDRHVWDLLDEQLEVRINPQELAGTLMPLLPRFYSLASSMMAVGEEAHLTIALTAYESNGRRRLGTASDYLCHRAPLYEAVIPVYLQPSKDFTLPVDDSAALIMIGPGTGVAPYRGFLQERVLRGATGKHWLFFGERHRLTHFYYGDYLAELESRGHLRLNLAFSRDQAHKVYVQHQLESHGAEVYRWIQDGAYTYVCGDAHRMAKDVDQALTRIIAQHGNKSDAEATEMLKKLRKDKRYLRDVY
jgi:sulfite reductase (NADPH) flavoprotein alpha-component